MENKKEEVSRLEEQVSGLKQSNGNLQKHVEDLLLKLKEVNINSFVLASVVGNSDASI